jgi:uncharacterized membrane protein
MERKISWLMIVTGLLIFVFAAYITSRPVASADGIVIWPAHEATVLCVRCFGALLSFLGCLVRIAVSLETFKLKDQE